MLTTYPGPFFNLSSRPPDHKHYTPYSILNRAIMHNASFLTVPWILLSSSHSDYRFSSRSRFTIRTQAHLELQSYPLIPLVCPLPYASHFPISTCMVFRFTCYFYPSEIHPSHSQLPSASSTYNFPISFILFPFNSTLRQLSKYTRFIHD